MNNSMKFLVALCVIIGFGFAQAMDDPADSPKKNKPVETTNRDQDKKCPDAPKRPSSGRDPWDYSPASKKRLFE